MVDHLPKCLEKLRIRSLSYMTFGVHMQGFLPHLRAALCSAPEHSPHWHTVEVEVSSFMINEGLCPDLGGLRQELKEWVRDFMCPRVIMKVAR